MAKEAKKTGEEVKVKAPAKVTKASKGEIRPWDFEQDVERALENFFNRGFLRTPRWEFPELKMFGEEQAPKVNVIDREDEVVIEAALPGVKKEDIEVSLGDESVTIKASTRKEQSEEKGDYHRREISTGEYMRTLPLGAAVDRDNAQAAYKDGVLTLTLPKTQASKRQTITIE